MKRANCDSILVVIYMITWFVFIFPLMKTSLSAIKLSDQKNTYF